MEFTLIRASQLCADHLGTWSRIQASEHALASPYFCPQFTQAVAAVRDDVFVTVLTENGKIIGFFPFQRGKHGVGKPVGGGLSDYQAVITSSATSVDAENLVRGSGLSAWDFDHLIASQNQFAPHHRVVARSPILDLSHGFDAYLNCRDANGAKRVKGVDRLFRQLRKLEREWGAVRFESHVTDPLMLKTLLHWKASQYLESGFTNPFSFEWIVKLIERISQTAEPEFAGSLSVLYTGNRAVAAHMGMRSKTVWHYWFPSYDRAFAKYSPGLILLLKMAESAQSLGITCIDLGKGQSQYKLELSTSAILIAEGSVELSWVRSRFRKFRRDTEAWVRGSPFAGVARYSRRLIRRLGDRLHL